MKFKFYASDARRNRHFLLSRCSSSVSIETVHSNDISLKTHLAYFR